MSFKYTTAISKLRKMKKSTKVVQGGASAGKTFGIIPILIDKAIKRKGLRIWIVACTYSHLEDGAIADFKTIMQSTNRWDEDCWHDTKHTYTFYNGSYIKFKAIDKPGKARGPRRDILYINEANVGIEFETYLGLEERTIDEVWIDFNPANEFWAHTEVMNSPNAEFLLLTYKDNEALSPKIIAKMEEMRLKAMTSKWWANRWQVYGLGQIGKLEGVIFENWETIFTVPSDAELLGYGCDFSQGGSDPATLIAVYKLTYLGIESIVLDQIFYKNGVSPSETISLFKSSNIDKSKKIWADNSQPGMIRDIKREGYKINAAEKGADSIQYGIGLMQNYPIYITEHSVETIDEFNRYSWAKDTYGVPTNKPEDKNNHTIDSVRYFYRMELTNKRKGKQFSFL